MIAYILALLLALPALVMTISLALAEYDAASTLYKYFSTKELLIMLAIAFIFVVIGWRHDTNIRKEIENEGKIGK